MLTVDRSNVPGEPDLVAQEKREGWALHRIINALRATWRIPLIATAVLFIVIVAGLAVLRVVLPSTTTFVSQLHFTFPSAEAGRYPNGVPFSINEILDPAVLDVVYNQLELDKYGLERKNFY